MRALPAGASALFDDGAKKQTYERFRDRARDRSDARVDRGAEDAEVFTDDSTTMKDPKDDARDGCEGARPRFAASNVGERPGGPGASTSEARYVLGVIRGRTWTMSDGWNAASGTFAAESESLDVDGSKRIFRAGEDGGVKFVCADDWSGEHVMVLGRESVEASTEGAWYRHARWASGGGARRIEGLRGVECSCATFVKYASSGESSGSGGGTIVRALVGTADGRVFDVRIDYSSDGKRFEQACERVFETKDCEKIAGVRAFKHGRGVDSRHGALISTSRRLYALVGSYSLESVFAKARAKPGGIDAVVEMPVASDTSELCVWQRRRKSPSSSSDCMAWLTGAGIYRGTLNFNVDDASSVLEQHGVLPFPQTDANDVGPISLAMTEHHILLLYSKSLIAVNAITGDVEGKIQLPSGGASTFACTDPTTAVAYVANERNLLQIVITNEDANVWRVHCDLHDYEQAIAACKSELQRQFVFTHKAERMMKMKRYEDAAEAFARASHAHSIEEVAKTFIDLNARDALYAYIEGRLRELPSDDVARRLILATWLLEERLKLASVSRDAKNDVKLRDFLREYFDSLDERETLRMLSEAKRLDDEMYFAELCGDFDRVLDHFMQLGDSRRALEIITSQRVPRETSNRVLPALIERLPKETIDFLLSRGQVSEDMKIIGPLAREERLFDKSSDAAKTILTHLARYLETITAKENGMARSDAAAHNLLLNLYVSQIDSSPTVVTTLNRYILGAVDEGTKEPFYDVQYAIRMCEKHGAHRSAVYAYCMSRNYDMAMHIALSTLQDIELAKMVTVKAAEAPSGDSNEDEIVQKKLWIEIAKWSIQKSGVLQQHANSESEEERSSAIRSALSFLNETNGALRVEDILPLLPDFTVIDDVKDLVLKSLTEHRSEIEHLREELERITAFTQDVQDEIEDLEQKTYIVKKDQKCLECGRPVVRLRLMEHADDANLLAPFYVFPCEMAYHTECLIRRVLPLMFPDERKRALALMRLLKVPLPRRLKPETKFWGAPPKAATGLTAEEAVGELEDMLCADCPDCGALHLRLIHEPLLTPEEQALDDALAAQLPESWLDPFEAEVDFDSDPVEVIPWEEFKEIKLPDGWPDHEFFRS